MTSKSSWRLEEHRMAATQPARIPNTKSLCVKAVRFPKHRHVVRHEEVHPTLHEQKSCTMRCDKAPSSGDRSRRIFSSSPNILIHCHTEMDNWHYPRSASLSQHNHKPHQRGSRLLGLQVLSGTSSLFPEASQASLQPHEPDLHQSIHLVDPDLHCRSGGADK